MFSPGTRITTALDSAMQERLSIVDTRFDETVLFDLLEDLLDHHFTCRVDECPTCIRSREIMRLLLVPFEESLYPEQTIKAKKDGRDRTPSTSS
jgi:hypothetical protein